MGSLTTGRRHSFFQVIVSFILVTFITGSIIPLGMSYAQIATPASLGLPPVGSMLSSAPLFTPALIKGLTLHPDNPLQFDFIIDTGDAKLANEALSQEAQKLIKYFLASLTVPEDQLWVNLSPYEKGRIIPEGFGQTEMGRDMLVQDYILKQLMSSLMYPENELGKKFWQRVYEKTQALYGETSIPLNTFNKVWIVPEQAIVVEDGGSAYIVKSHLKVMLQEDYKALNHYKESAAEDKSLTKDDEEISGVSTEVIRQVLIPELEREVNEGEHFANLRQIFNSLILAAWYKVRLKEGLLGKVYVNQNKTRGIDTEDKQIKEKIYEQYLQAFQKGVYDYIKDEYNPATQEIIPRHYFSGGVDPRLKYKEDSAMVSDGRGGTRILPALIFASVGLTLTTGQAYSAVVPSGSPLINFTVQLADVGPGATDESVNALKEKRYNFAQATTGNPNEVQFKNGPVLHVGDQVEIEDENIFTGIKTWKKGVVTEIKEDGKDNFGHSKKSITIQYKDGTQSSFSAVDRFTPLPESFRVLSGKDQAMQAEQAIPAASERLPWETDAFLKLKELTTVRSDDGQVFLEGIEYVGNSQEIETILKQVQTMVRVNISDPILITGKTGTGKELTWKLFHRLNVQLRQKDPVVIHVYDWNDLSGDRRADEMVKAFQKAKDGFLILDGIEDAIPEVQGKLLRMLEDKLIEGVDLGDIHVIGLRNKEWPQTYRQDLINRFQIKMTLPTLEQRVEDRILLYEYYNHKLSEQYNLTWKPLSITAALLLGNDQTEDNEQIRGVQALVKKVLQQRLMEPLNEEVSDESLYTMADELVNVGLPYQRTPHVAEKAARLKDSNGNAIDFDSDLINLNESHPYVQLVHGERPFWGLNMPENNPMMRVLMEKRVSEDRARQLIYEFNFWLNNNFEYFKTNRFYLREEEISLFKDREERPHFKKRGHSLDGIKMELGEVLPNGEYEVYIQFQSQDKDYRVGKFVTSLEGDGVGLWILMNMWIFQHRGETHDDVENQLNAVFSDPKQKNILDVLLFRYDKKKSSLEGETHDNTFLNNNVDIVLALVKSWKKGAIHLVEAAFQSEALKKIFASAGIQGNQAKYIVVSIAGGRQPQTENLNLVIPPNDSSESNEIRKKLSLEISKQAEQMAVEGGEEVRNWVMALHEKLNIPQTKSQSPESTDEAMSASSEFQKIMKEIKVVVNEMAFDENTSERMKAIEDGMKQLAPLFEVNMEDVEASRLERLANDGGFVEGIMLKRVLNPEGNVLSEPNKLVRDKTLENIQKSGNKAEFIKVTGSDYQQALLEKLKEEFGYLEKVMQDQNPQTDKIIHEMAAVKEVLISITLNQMKSEGVSAMNTKVPVAKITERVIEALEQVQVATSEKELPEKDAAQTAEATNDPLGGIDFNPALLDLQIKRDGRGIPLPLPQQPLDQIKIEGFIPIIINFRPISSLPMLLGFDTKSSNELAQSSVTN